MSTLTALARAEAVRDGCAQPIATVRHVHRHDRPLVFVPLALAGEANAPLAALVGADRRAPRLLFVAQPRNRDERFAFAAQLATIVLPYLDSFSTEVEAVSASRGKEIRVRYADAPQILVPNRGGLGFIGLFGRSTRFRRTDGDFAVAPVVPVLGQWLTFLADRADYPGSSLLVAATDLLTRHWATGQSAVEDQNLAALLAWIDPPAGRTGAQAARAAEAEAPPAGPATDPDFDNDVLARLINNGDAAALGQALDAQLRPTWDLIWRSVDLLDGIPPGQRVASRWDEDKDAYTGYLTYVREGGLPQARRDTAVAAAGRLHRLELAQARFDAQRAMDDPLIFAEHRLTGEAFIGTVTDAEPNRLITSASGRRTLRPLVTVTTADAVRVAPGTAMTALTRPGQTGIVKEVDGADVVLEISGGMGRSLTPEPGTVPEVGEALAYTSVSDGYQPTATFPAREDTPWTHGGPPPEYRPTDDDAQEVWE